MTYDKYYRVNRAISQRKEVGDMDVKLTSNYSVYQNAVNSGRHVDKSVSVPSSADKKMRGDAICISSGGAKMSEASSYASALRKSMDEGAPADRIAALKQQVSEGVYQVPAKQIAKRLISGL